ncbi:MAG: tRNA pseudouridine(55) synthase TruB [Pseudomonadota bacterium]|nr:tRNA pseudouridine(55) synthase TruB [Pseudomonadota bacterium]
MTNALSDLGRSGFLLIDKPQGLTSAAVVAMVKKRYHIKTGHTGTLDPLATGMLVLCLGQASKFSQYNLNADKRYRVTIELGYETDTCDTTGKVLQYGPVNKLDTAAVSSLLHSVFFGKITQIPPIYSALKYRGKPYYYYARKGINIPIKKRQVSITKYHNITSDSGVIQFIVDCSSGTYIRSLARDIGRLSDNYATLSQLQRIHIAPWRTEKMLQLDRLPNKSELDAYLQPIDSVLHEYPSLSIQLEQLSKLQNGVRISINSDTTPGIYKIYLGDDFYGLVSVEHSLVQPIKVLR